MRDLRTLPKAHLHVHLESAVRWSTLRELGAANGVDVPAPPRLPFDGFTAFTAARRLARACLRRPADFHRVAAEFCADEAAAGTRYVEVSFTAAAHGERLGDLDMPLVSVLTGLADGAREHGLEYGVILDHSRRRPVERARRTVELALRYADRGVVAVGLAGDETHPLGPFAGLFEAASDAGLHVVHHAGENGGPQNVREAITVGRAERIGHGIRALEDAQLVEELRRLRIPLEVCPSSNVAIGFAPTLAAHPLPRLRAAGLRVTVNTDIPALTGTDLATEFGLVRDAFGYDDAVLAELAAAAVDASFAPATTKAWLHTGIAGWLTAPDGGTRHDSGPASGCFTRGA